MVTRCPRCGSEEIGDMEEILGVGWERMSELALATKAMCWKCEKPFIMVSRYVDSGEFEIYEPEQVDLKQFDLSKKNRNRSRRTDPANDRENCDRGLSRVA